MNILLQIGIGLLPLLIFAYLYMIKKRLYSFKRIVTTALLTIIILGISILGLIPNNKGSYARHDLNKDMLLEIAYALHLNGEYEKSLDIARYYEENFAHGDEIRILRARNNFKLENFDKARSDYTNLKDKNIESIDFDKLYSSKLSSKEEIENKIVAEYIEKAGKDPKSYGYDLKKAEINEKEYEKLIQKINHEINVNVSKVNISKPAKEYLDFLIDTDTEDSDDIILPRKDFNAYRQIPIVEKTYVNKMIKKDNFKSLFDRLESENYDYKDVILLNELIVNDYIKDEDLPENYVYENDTKDKDTKKIIENIKNKALDNPDTKNLENLNKEIEAFNNFLDNPKLKRLKSDLAKMVNPNENDETSKAYLALSKFDNYIGTKSSAMKHIEKAIETADLSQDKEYSASLNELKKITKTTKLASNEAKDFTKSISKAISKSLDYNIRKKDSEKSSIDSLLEFYVNDKKSSLLIGDINLEKFPNISSEIMINISGKENIKDIKKSLLINDTGVDINNFTLEKIDHTRFDISLVCDSSGSMLGSMGDLSNAIISFIKNKNINDRLNIYYFTLDIKKMIPFGKTDAELLKFASEAPFPDGGTNILGAVSSSLSSFSNEKNVQNIVIVLTDGRDMETMGSGPAPIDNKKINRELRSLINKTNARIFPIGLGDNVDINYLNVLSNISGGTVLQVGDSKNIELIYNNIQSKMKNLYRLSYKAPDTLDGESRYLEVSFKGENSKKERKYYSIGEGKDNFSDKDFNVNKIIPKSITYSKKEQTIRIEGSGFKPSDSLIAKLLGENIHDIKTKYIDKNTIELKIPARVDIGKYDLSIIVNSKERLISNALEIFRNEERKITKFGEYVFTSYKKTIDTKGNIMLSGNVMLNDWLVFKGDLELIGDLQSGSIEMKDYSGSYIPYDFNTARGHAKELAKEGLVSSISPLGNVTLYNDPERKHTGEEHQVDDVELINHIIPKLLLIDKPVANLYPHHINFKTKIATSILPFQAEIIKSVYNTMFDLNLEGNIVYTSKEIVLIGKAESKAYAGDFFTIFNKAVNLGGKLNIEIDTLKKEYSIDSEIEFDFFAKDTRLIFEITWKENLIPDSITIGFDKAIPLKISTVLPIELGEFKFKASDIHRAIKEKNPFAIKFTGSLSISSLKLKEYIPKLKRFVGDLSLIEMPDTAATLRLSPFEISLDAAISILGEIDLSKASIQIGEFDYNEFVFDTYHSNAKGVRASLKQGIMIDSFSDRFKLDLSGESEYEATDVFLGIRHIGTFKYDIAWWLINLEKALSGELAFGVHLGRYDKKYLAFSYKFKDSSGKFKSKIYYIDENGNFGSSNGKFN